jgi:hypothetical protein
MSNWIAAIVNEAKKRKEKKENVPTTPTATSSPTRGSNEDQTGITATHDVANYTISDEYIPEGKHLKKVEGRFNGLAKNAPKTSHYIRAIASKRREEDETRTDREKAQKRRDAEQKGLLKHRAKRRKLRRIYAKEPEPRVYKLPEEHLTELIAGVEDSAPKVVPYDQSGGAKPHSRNSPRSAHTLQASSNSRVKQRERIADQQEKNSKREMHKQLRVRKRNAVMKEQVEIVESYAMAEDHKVKAMKAHDKGDSIGHHMHMHNHHSSLATYHGRKNRWGLADAHGKKADDHLGMAYKLREEAKLAGHEVTPFEGPHYQLGPDAQPEAKSRTKAVVKAAVKKMAFESKGVCPDCGMNPCECDHDDDEDDKKTKLKGSQKKLDKNHNGKLDKQDFKMLRKEETELKGKQNKLDKNHNGKLDSQDFKMLRGQKTNEEALGDHAGLAKYADKHGRIDKEDLHTAAKHIKSGNMEALKKHLYAMDTDPRDKALEHVHKKHYAKLGYSNEEVELDEISQDTLGRYRRAAKSERMDPEKGAQRKAGMGLALKKILGTDTVGNKPKVKATNEEALGDHAGFKTGDKVSYETSKGNKNNKGTVHSVKGDTVTVKGSNYLGGDVMHDVHHSMVKKMNESHHIGPHVKKDHYDWGRMLTVHHGKSHSFPMHPEHQDAIHEMKDGESLRYKDETNSTVHAARDGDMVHLSRLGVNTPTIVHHSHFGPDHHAEETELHEAKRGRPRKNAGKTDEENPDREHIIMGMRKAISLRGMHPVAFDDGKKHLINPGTANRVLNKHDSMKTPSEKQAFAARIARSKESMHDALAGKPEEVVPAISLGGSKNVGGIRANSK